MNNILFSFFLPVRNVTSQRNEHSLLPLRCKLKTKNRAVMTTLLYTFVYFLSLYSPTATSAQVIHQSFELGDLKAIQISLDIPYSVETWAGNTILTETKVKMENIPPNILKHFIKLGRYEIVETVSDNSFELKLKEMDRRPIRTKNGEAVETINIRILVPEDCSINQQGKGTITAQETGQ